MTYSIDEIKQRGTFMRHVVNDIFEGDEYSIDNLPVYIDVTIFKDNIKIDVLGIGK